MRTYVKLYRKIVENEFLANDNTAFVLFIKILLRVNWQTGEMTTGRYKLGQMSNLKPITAYKALKRLENAKMVSLVTAKGTNKYTVVKVLNWQKYQSDNSTGNNQVTIKELSSNTYNKNKRIKEEKNIYTVETQSVYDHYRKYFNKNPNTYKLTNSRKLKIKQRLKDAGKDMLLKAITNTSQSSFHMGDNDRGWVANLDYIIRSYEQVEKLADMNSNTTNTLSVSEMQKDMEYVI